MHPLLAPHLHDKCLELIEMLNKCHDEHKFGKFLGKCNDIERNLQRCLKAESKERRQRNMEESKRRKEKFKKITTMYILKQVLKLCGYSAGKH